MPVCAEAQPGGRVPAAERYVVPSSPYLSLPTAWPPGPAAEGKCARLGRSRKHEAAHRCIFQLLRGLCSVALADLSVLLCMCHLCELRFDNLPVK